MSSTGSQGAVGAGGHEEEARRGAADDVAHVGGGALVELGEEPGERRTGVVRRDGRRRVVVDPGVAR